MTAHRVGRALGTESLDFDKVPLFPAPIRTRISDDLEMCGLYFVRSTRRGNSIGPQSWQHQLFQPLAVRRGVKIGLASGSNLEARTFD